MVDVAKFCLCLCVPNLFCLSFCLWYIYIGLWAVELLKIEILLLLTFDGIIIIIIIIII
jgi:hypothetical protein